MTSGPWPIIFICIAGDLCANSSVPIARHQSSLLLNLFLLPFYPGLEWSNPDLEDNYSYQASYDLNNGHHNPMPSSDKREWHVTPYWVTLSFIHRGSFQPDSVDIKQYCGIIQDPIWIPFGIRVRSRNCGCLVNWFCYQLIAKPGNKTALVPWPHPLYTKLQSFNPSIGPGVEILIFW